MDAHYALERERGGRARERRLSSTAQLRHDRLQVLRQLRHPRVDVLLERGEPRLDAGKPAQRQVRGRDAALGQARGLFSEEPR